MSVFSPSLEEIENLPTKLNPGERYDLEALEMLDNKWLVYVQPMLLMDNPDFVIVHDSYGVCAIEVKDWQNGIYQSRPDGTIEVFKDARWHQFYWILFRCSGRIVADCYFQIMFITKNLLYFYFPHMASMSITASSIHKD